MAGLMFFEQGVREARFIACMLSTVPRAAAEGVALGKARPSYLRDIGVKRRASTSAILVGILMRQDGWDSGIAVKRFFSFLMLVGALVGLLGQEAAFASGPAHLSAPAAKMTVGMAQMSSDCMAMMQQAPQPAQKPCKGLTLDCIASMGCVIPLASTPEPLLAGKFVYERIQHFPARIDILAGQALEPEPDPPTRLI
ncbi:hypothetical protein [Sphingobium sp.]|uniref:hypothetical protein n=1 Tax=Sphingobium sp. TaxID=1912891 RepID=UPI0028BF31D4|nr:hypothetical protein [Sphingobium sp.]